MKSQFLCPSEDRMVKPVVVISRIPDGTQHIKRSDQQNCTLH